MCALRSMNLGLAVALLAMSFAFLVPTAPAAAASEFGTRTAPFDRLAARPPSVVRERFAATATAYGAAVGTRMEFALRFRQRLEVTTRSEEGEPAALRPLDVSATGRLAITVVDRQADEIRIYCTVSGLERTVAGERVDEDDPWPRELADTMVGGFEVRLAPDGRVMAFDFDRGVTDEQRAWARTVFGAFSFEMEEHGGPWIADATDGIGHHRFRYATGSRHGTAMVVRERIACRPIQGDGGPDCVRLGGQAHAIFDPDLGWLRYASIDERIAWDADGLSTSYVAHLDGALVLEGVERVPMDEAHR